MKKILTFFVIAVITFVVVWTGSTMSEYDPANAVEIESDNNNDNELQKLKQEIQQLKKDMIAPKETPIAVSTPTPLKKENVILALNNNLNGKLKDKGELFYFAGKMYNVNPMLVASIAIHETANGTSNAIKTKNNIGGIMKNANKGILRKYEDVDLCIAEMSRLLKINYIDLGYNNIDAIGMKYCPVGANNDPTNLNKNWIPIVTKNYIKILKQAEGGI